MDDCLTGANSAPELLNLKDNIVSILESAGFECHKWVSNCKELLNTIAMEKQEKCLNNYESDKLVSSLGLKNSVKNDYLKINVPEMEKIDVLTKRLALSCISKIFDPLGYIGIVIVKIKYFIQIWTFKDLNWKFSIPLAPHMNGICESGIKLIKYHLKRVIGENVLTYEQLNTLLIYIESILNSRPLCGSSNDVDDLKYLSPGHFLIGDSLTSYPEPNISEQRRSGLSHWKQICQMRQSFWSRFYK